MQDENLHVMRLDQMHPSGQEEWVCPTCGRRVLIAWGAAERMVLAPGDEQADHVGGQPGRVESSLPGLAGGRPDVRYWPEPAARPLPVEELGAVPITDELRPWLRFIEQSSIDWRFGTAA